MRILTKVVNQDAKTTGRVTKAVGHLGPWQPVHEKGTQGFVLAMRGVGGFEEDPTEVC